VPAGAASKTPGSYSIDNAAMSEHNVMHGMISRMSPWQRQNPARHQRFSGGRVSLHDHAEKT
jgi:hypothetical protein